MIDLLTTLDFTLICSTSFIWTRLCAFRASEISRCTRWSAGGVVTLAIDRRLNSVNVRCVRQNDNNNNEILEMLSAVRFSSKIINYVVVMSIWHNEQQTDETQGAHSRSLWSCGDESGSRQSTVGNRYGSRKIFIINLSERFLCL